MGSTWDGRVPSRPRTGDDAPSSAVPAVEAVAIDEERRERFVRTVMRVAGCDYDTAEDIAQDVALRVLLAGRSLPTHEDWFRYLVDAALNIARDRARRGERDASRTVELAVQAVADAETLASTDLSDVVAAREEWQAVLADMRALPPAQREALELRYLDGLMPREIAARLGLTRRQVEVRLREGKKRLEAGERRRRAATWLFALYALRRVAAQQRLGPAEAAAVASQTPVLVIGAVTLSLVAVLAAPPAQQSAAESVRVRSRVEGTGQTRSSMNTRAGAGPGPVGRGHGTSAANLGAATPVRPDSGSADGPTVVLPNAPRGVPSPCPSACHPEDMSGDVVTLILLGPDGPSANEEVTPICHFIPDNQAVACRRGQEPEDWRVKEIGPSPSPSGSPP